MNVLAVGNGSSSRIWRERSGEGPAARESGASPRGMAAAAVAFLAALLLLPGEARANDRCGAITGTPLEANCDGTAANGATVSGTTGTYGNITYAHSAAGEATVHVGAKSGSLANIVLTATSSAAVFINASGGNAVLKAGGASTVTVTGGGSSSGFYIWRGSGAGTSTITIEGDVTIGADGSPIATGNNTAGIRILQETAGAATITSAATIYANRLGIWFSRNGANSGTTADSRVENTGNIHVTGGHGIYAWYARSSDTADTGDLTVTSSGDITTTAATGRGISVDYRGHGDLTVGHTGGTITSNHQGVFVSHGEAGANNQAGSGDTTINIGGDITAATRTAVQLYQIEGTGDITVMMTGGDLVATADNSDGIFIERAPNSSGNEAANSGAMTVTTTGGSITGRYGIEVRDNTMYTGVVTISNGADVTASNHGLYVSRRGDGATSITNTGGTVVSEGWNGIFVENRGGATPATDHVTVTVTGGTVQAKAKADPVAAALATLPSAAAANRAKGAAVLAMNRGTGDVIVEISGGDDTMLISKYNAGIFARLWEGAQVDDTTTNNGSQIKVTQGGTIQGRKGVYAFVAPYSTAATAVARTTPAEPVIDVTWMGTFSHGTTATVAPNDDDRFVAATVASGFDLDREVQAGQVEGSIRYGAPAGIEAQVMTWRDVVEQVAQGDRGRADAAIADDTARQALFNTADPADPSDADQVALKARSDALVLQAKAAIENGDIMVESGSALETALAAIAAIDTSNAAGEYTVEEVAGYLAVDNIVNRAALADLMSRGLSDKEKAVLAAMATGDEAAVDTALDDEAAGFSDDYKTAVKAFLNRYNVGNIRVNMTGGSINSRGDGIRAYYATPNANNGAINVSVAAGTTVTGAMAGIYVANAGNGLQIEKKYAPHAIRNLESDAGEDDLIAMGGLNADGDAMPWRNQLVTVAGMVTGGTDAAVHLVGGGALIVMEGGKVHAGDSGVAVRVGMGASRGPAHVFIDGEVKGKAPAEGEDRAPAAVHLAGGSVIVGVHGMVEANGATNAIQGDVQGDNGTTRVVFQVATDGMTDDGRRHVVGDGTESTVSLEGAMAAAARVDGSIAGDGITGEEGGGVFLALADAQGATGMEMKATLENGSLDVSDFKGAPCPDDKVRGADGTSCVAPPPPQACPEGQVRGDDGMCAVPPPQACPEGQVRGDDGMCAVPPPQACPEGQVRGDDGMCAVPPPSPPQPCPAGEVRGDDGMCRAMTRPPAMEVVVRESRDEGIRYEYMPEDSDREPIVVTVAAGTTVKSSGDEAGIYLAGAELGDVEMDSERGRSLYLQADVMNLRQHFVTVNGTVTGGTRDAAVHLVGGGMLLVGPDGRLNAGTGQPAVLVNDPGEAIIVINGEVKGSTGARAAVHLTGGGSVTVGPGGSVEANGADFAIRGDNEATTVRLLVAADGMTGDRRHVDDSTVTQAGAQEVATGVQGGVTGDGITGPDGGGVKVAVLDSNGDTGMDDPRKVIINSDGSLDFSNFDDDPLPPPSLTMNCGSATDGRCRLYEALPSALLAMNGLPTYEERMSAARDAKGGWARVEAARGKWKADSSTQENVAYDHRRHGVRAGMDFAMGDAGGVGVSVHGLRGSAEMTGGGEIDLSGAGVGVHATRALDGGFHVDAQAAVTWYQADLESMLGSTLKKDVNGRGYALGVEVGKRLPGMDGGVTVTPRAGLLWSKADLDDFRDARRATVSVKEAQSLKGRAGVGMEKVLDGDGMDGSRLFASLDVEQEFKEETEASLVMVSGTTLKASARKTRIRAAAGAVHAWGEGRYALQGSLGYTAGGGGNRDFGGGLSFAMRF